VGILIAGASGLCSLFFVFSALRLAFASPYAGSLGLLFFVVPVGGIPFAIGFGLFRWGRSIVRQAEDRPDRHFR
jgi:hypothetical protein